MEETAISIVSGLWSAGMCVFISGAMLLRSATCGELCFASFVGLIAALAGAEVHTQIIIALSVFICLDILLSDTLRNALRRISHNRGRPQTRRMSSGRRKQERRGG